MEKIDVLSIRPSLYCLDIILNIILYGIHRYKLYIYEIKYIVRRDIAKLNYTTK